MDTRACIPPYDTFPFCDTSLEVDARVADLISRLKDDEIPPLLTAREGGGGSPGPPGNISRLGLPEFDWGANCIHGAQTSCIRLADGKVYCPTSFPNPVNFGATFNDTQAYVMGSIIGTEMRALWVAGATEESDWSGRPHIGLDCWSPNINIARDPRWGRNQEVPGEDPLLNGRFGTEYTRGLQEGNDPNYIQVVVTLKHWAAYSLENSDNFTRFNFNAEVKNSTLQEIYFPAFKAAVVDGKAKGVMCSYNALNGVPTCASGFLNSVLRDTWGFDGYVTSDTGAITNIYRDHKYVPTSAEAACKAIRDGRCDINSDAVYINSLLDGVRQGNCTMDDVKLALTHTLKLRFELGLFDPVDNQTYWHVPPSAIGTTSSNQTRLLTTLESMVLLKNSNSTLPLQKGRSVVVIGPHSETRSGLVGNYLGQLCPDRTHNCVKNIYEAISDINTDAKVTAVQGCSLTKNDTSGFAEAVAAARSADYVVLALGIDQSIEAESRDRTTIDLPDIQHRLASVIVALGKPTSLVLLNGGMVAIEKEMQTMSAILSAGYPGVEGADAVAKTLYGENDHLGGKLPYTVYPADYIDDIKMSEMEFDVGPGRTYRYYTGTPLYKFGYGISLTKFTITPSADQPHAHQLVTSDQPTSFGKTTFVVKNVGDRTGDEVVMLYTEPKRTPTQATRLRRQLVAYKRVHLQPGEEAHVTFDVNTSMFHMVDKVSGDIVSAPGNFHLVAENGVDQAVRMLVTVTGEEKIVEPFPRF